MDEVKSNKEVEETCSSRKASFADLQKVERNLEEIMEKTTSIVFGGLYCEIDLTGNILCANQRLQVLRKHCYREKKNGVAEENFLDFVSKSRKEVVLKKINSLSKAQGGNFHGFLSIPFQVENFEYGVRTECKFSEKKVILFISANELQKLQNVQLIRIKTLIEQKKNKGLWVLDDQGIVRHVAGESIFKNLGWKDSEIIGMNYATFVQEEKAHLTENGVYQIFRRRKFEGAIETEVQVKRMTLHDGHEYTVHLDSYGGD